MKKKKKESSNNALEKCAEADNRAHDAETRLSFILEENNDQNNSGNKTLCFFFFL